MHGAESTADSTAVLDRPPAYVPVSEAPVGTRALSAGFHSLHFLSALMMLGDGLVITGAFMAVQLLRSGNVSGSLTLPALLTAALLLMVMRGAGAYSLEAKKRLTDRFNEVFGASTGVFALLLISDQVTNTRELLHGSSMLQWYLVSLVGLGLIRALAHMQIERLRRSARLARTVAVVDAGGRAHTLACGIQRQGNSDVRLVGVFSSRSDANPGISDLINIARRSVIDEILIVGADSDDHAVRRVVRALATVPTNVHVSTQLLQNEYPRLEPNLLFGHPVLTIHRRPLGGWAGVLKRAEDISLGVLFLLLLLPLMGAIALLIKLDSTGPVLFRQKRQGLNNAVFEILKFRTMAYVPGPEFDVPQARRNDPRVTRVGRFLRRSSLDELPQLFNVLTGDMSLVGPRPHAVPHNDKYASMIEDYWGRHKVRPGITGWAQVNGLRGETDTPDKMQRRIEYDLDYISRWSLLLDIKVIIMTVIVCFLGRKAY